MSMTGYNHAHVCQPVAVMDISSAYINFDSYGQNDLPWQDLILSLCVNRRLPCSFHFITV